MKKIEIMAAKKRYKLSFTDKSGNWIGGYKRGGYIIIVGNGFRKECSSISEAIEFLS